MVDIKETARPAARSEGDTAEQSLNDALRISFKILTVLMVVIVAAFALTGVKRVNSGQRAIRLLFGRVVGTAEQGLVYTWPFPIGGIELVDISEQTLTVEDFWMNVPPEDRTRTLQERARRVPAAGLHPGLDGVLLTGDRYLLHVRLECKYEIADVVAWWTNVGSGGWARPLKGEWSDADVAGFRETSRSARGDEREIIRSAVASAAIRAAATRTADGLQRGQKAEFLNEVQQLAQAELNALNSGILIKAVQLPGEGMVWPLRSLPAFDAVTRARSEMDSKVNEARGEAESILNSAAGPAYRRLVGEPWRGLTGPVAGQGGDGEAAQQIIAAAGDEQPSEDLIGQYGRAVSQGRHEDAQRLLAEIDHVLLTGVTGQASTVIEEARTYSSEVTRRIIARANRFHQLLAAMPDDPAGRRTMFERLWAEVHDEILASTKIEKYYLSTAGGRTIIFIGRDRGIQQQVEQELKRATDEGR